MEQKTLTLWKKFTTLPCGKWLFSTLVCFKAPYFGSIRPRFVDLRQGYAELRITKRRAVLNHIGTVHAIAMCNMAELAGCTMTDVSIPTTHRWIPKEMTVKYLKRAETDLRAIATPRSQVDVATAGDYLVDVQVLDRNGVAVFSAEITMGVWPKKQHG